MLQMIENIINKGEQLIEGSISFILIIIIVPLIQMHSINLVQQHSINIVEVLSNLLVAG